MKNKTLYIICCLLFVAAVAEARILKFQPNAKYRIESVLFDGGSIALGKNHGINTPVCVERNVSSARQADCYWYFDYKGDGKYAIRNVSDNTYMTSDDDYGDSPQYLRYLHMSKELEGDASLWYIQTTENPTYGTIIYFQNVEKNTRYFNLRPNFNVLGLYGSSVRVPDGVNEMYRIYDDNNKLYVPEDMGEEPVEPVEPDEPVEETDSTLALLPINCDVLHIYCADGSLDAIPVDYIKSREDRTDSLVINTVNGMRYAYANYEVDSLSNIVPEMPAFKTFKFNNKYNRNIASDAQGLFYGDTLITATVVGIGKNLRASFSLDDDVQAWIYDKLQTSKYSGVRFDHDIHYTIARGGYTVLRQTLDSTFVVRPYGRETIVRVDFTSDKATGTYGVPVIYITTNSGNMISSKTTYVAGKIRIDGANVFPDMPETDMEIKGRGNTSWAGTWGKSPYHFKFEFAQKPLGLTKGKHWNLIANAQRNSMTTNAIAMKVAGLVGAAAANHEIPVELYINGDYRGSYNLTEKIGLSNNSVDLDDESKAALLELDSYYDEPETQKFRTNNYNLPVNIKAPDFKEDVTTLDLEMIKTSFNRLPDKLAAGEDIQYVADLDYLARFLLVNEFVANFELMHPKSTYCHISNVWDIDSKFIFGPVWDFDWAYGYAGSSNYFTTYSTVDYWERPDGKGQPFMRKLRYNGEKFDKIYYNLWYDFVNSGKLDELIDYCDDYYKFAAKSFTHDNTKWGHGDANTYATITKNAKSWLRTRANYILDYMTNTLDYGSKNYLEPMMTPDLGDVNGDGRISTADVVCILNHILGLPNEEFYFAQADVDGNSVITISDLLKVRNMISTTLSKGFYGLPEADAVIATEAVSVEEQSVRVPLTVSVDEGSYCGMQFDLKVPAGMVVENLDFCKSMPDFDISIQPVESGEYSGPEIDRYRVSIYSSANHLMPAGSFGMELTLGANDNGLDGKALIVSFDNVMFVTAMGEDERSVSRSASFVMGDATGIGSAVTIDGQNGNGLTLNAKEDSNVIVYTLDGRIFRTYSVKSGKQQIRLPKGIYIINKQKVIVR